MLLRRDKDYMREHPGCSECYDGNTGEDVPCPQKVKSAIEVLRENLAKNLNMPTNPSVPVKESVPPVSKKEEPVKEVIEEAAAPLLEGGARQENEEEDGFIEETKNKLKRDLKACEDARDKAVAEAIKNIDTPKHFQGLLENITESHSVPAKQVKEKAIKGAKKGKKGTVYILYKPKVHKLFFIGQSSDPENRIRVHRHSLKDKGLEHEIFDASNPTETIKQMFSLGYTLTLDPKELLSL